MKHHLVVSASVFEDVHNVEFLSLLQVTFSTGKIMIIKNDLLIYIVFLTYNNQKLITMYNTVHVYTCTKCVHKLNANIVRPLRIS